MVSNLLNKLKTKSGQLAETSTEELAAQVGRPIQPVTPLSSAGIGANPDQAKMVGSSAQRVSALRSALDQPNLDTTLRTTQKRTQATGKEQVAIDQANRLNNLKNIGTQYQLGTQNLGTTPNLTLTPVANQSPEQINLLNRIKANPADQNAILEFSKLNGKAMTGEEILQSYDIITDPVTGKLSLGQDTQNAIGVNLANNINDNLTLQNVNFQELGFTGPEEVASLLELSPEELNKLTPEKLSQTINSKIAEDYQNVSNLETKANNVNLGAAERAEARAQLRDLGAVGVKAVESDVDKLADILEEDPEIEFMGEEVPVSELLDSDYISGIVANYFDNPEFKAKLKKNEPALYNFIEQNERSLQDMAKQVDQTAKDFAAIQEQNKDLSKTTVGTISPEIMDKILPGFNNLTTQDYSKGPLPPIVKALKSSTIDDMSKQNLYNNLNLVNKLAPEFIQEFKDLPEQELIRLGFFDKDSPQWKQTSEGLNLASKIKALQPGDTKGLANLFGKNDINELYPDISLAKSMKSSGLFPPSFNPTSLFGTSLAISDTPDWNSVISNLKRKGTDAWNLQDLINKGSSLNKLTADFTDFISKVKTNPTAPEVTAFNKLSPILNKNLVTAIDLQDIAPTLTIDELDTIGKNKNLNSRLTNRPDKVKMLDSAGLASYQDSMIQRYTDTGGPGFRYNDINQAMQDTNIKNLYSLSDFLNQEISRAVGQNNNYSKKYAQKLLADITNRINTVRNNTNPITGGAKASNNFVTETNNTKLGI